MELSEGELITLTQALKLRIAVLTTTTTDEEGMKILGRTSQLERKLVSEINSIRRYGQDESERP